MTEETKPYSDNLEYLQHELEWIKTRCNRMIAERKIEDLTGESDRPNWHQHDPDALPGLETRRDKLRQLETSMRQALDARLEMTRETSVELALDELCKLYDLNDFERTIVLMAVAVAFSRRFEELYGEMQYSFHALTIEVVFNFCELPFAERITRRRAFARSGRLVQNDLISVAIATRMHAPEDLLSAHIQLSNRTFGFLVGDNELMDEFMEFSSVEEPRARFEQVVLDPADKERITSVIERHDEYLKYRQEWGFDDVIQYGRGVLMLFYGRPGTGKTMMAHAVAHEMNKRVLNVDIPTFLNHVDADRFLPALFREARMQDAVVFFDECEVLFGDRAMGNSLMTLLLTEIERFEGVAILATNLPQHLDEALDRRIMVKVRFPEPDRVARRTIWQKHLPEKAPLADDVDLEILADRFEMTGGYIKNSVLTALADAVHRDAGNAAGPVITMDHLERAARAQIAPVVEQNSSLVNPSVRLPDVIMTERLRSHVGELVEAARHRRTVLERWGIGQNLSYGKGVSALFFGKPGTGKTMCAEAVASELNRPLLVGSIAGLKSKWVGETERNLSKLFDQARAHNAVLFLDEADSLLRERGEGHASRHDDSIVNVLLTRIERHNGVVLLATNREASLDSALDRRLTYLLEFEFPTAPLRAKIWRSLLPESVPLADDVDLEHLGKRYALSGGLIKKAVFKAAFRAAPVGDELTMALLEEAAQEEMRDDGKVIGFA